MPELVPSVSDVVPAGFTVVHLAAVLIPKIFATRAFSSFTIFAAVFMSSPKTAPEPMPVIEIPTRASLSVVFFHTSLK